MDFTRPCPPCGTIPVYGDAQVSQTPLHAGSGSFRRRKALLDFGRTAVVGAGTHEQTKGSQETQNGRPTQELILRWRNGLGWFPIWQTSANLLRQLTKEDREARKSSGTLLSRSAVIAELSQLVEALRIMMESMPAKILAELQRSSSKRIRRITRLLAEPLKEATQRAVFQNLECLTSPESAQETLKLNAA